LRHEQQQQRGDMLRELEQILGPNYWTDFADDPAGAKDRFIRLLCDEASSIK